ncbi:hypothetical protein B0H14DRAFT_3146988 [Mycena olivaceomarginata]|nr:hypothetical protein B0H14DRAFT_3146988 [Mycena olivaceomarginata]
MGYILSDQARQRDDCRRMPMPQVGSQTPSSINAAMCTRSGPKLQMCPSLLSTGSGVFSEFQLTLMTPRFDGLESIIGRAQSSCLDAHTSFETNSAEANVYKGNGPTKILMKMILIKGWDVTEATLRKALEQASQGPRAVPCYSIQDCEFSLVLSFHWLIRLMLKPGGVLNILDLTSINTSKGAMVLCARVALMACGSFLSRIGLFTRNF